MVYTKMQYACGALIPKVGGVLKNCCFALTGSAADVFLTAAQFAGTNISLHANAILPVPHSIFELFLVHV